MDSSRTSGACVEQLSVWVGAGLVTAGMSAALVAGASAASADSGLGADSSGGASSNLSGSDSKGSDATKPRPKPDQPDKTDAEGPLDAADETSTPDAAKNEQPEPTGQVSQGSKGFQGKGDRTTTRSKLTRVISPASPTRSSPAT